MALYTKKIYKAQVKNLNVYLMEYQTVSRNSKNVLRALFHPGHEATTFVCFIISYITGGLSQAT